MNELRNIIKDIILEQTKGPKGYAIFGYGEDTYDVYLATETIENYYFFTFQKGKFYDLDFNPISVDLVQFLVFETTQLIAKLSRKFILYNKIYIEEHNLLNNVSYKKPIETDAFKYSEIGYEKFEESNFSEAYKNYSIASSLEPYNSEYYKILANCYVKTKQFENAILEVCKAAIANPISKQNIFIFIYEDLGAIYRIAKDFNNAVKFYSLNYDNTLNKNVLLERAKCYVELGEYSLAISDFDKLLLKKREIKVLIEYADILIKNNNKSIAKVILNEIINFSFVSEEEWISNMMESRNKPIKDRARKMLSTI